MTDVLALARLHIGLMLKCIPAADVVAWADSEILRLPTAPAELIELSLAEGVPRDELTRQVERVMSTQSAAVIAEARAAWARSVLEKAKKSRAGALEVAEQLSELTGSLYFPWEEFVDGRYFEVAFKYGRASAPWWMFWRWRTAPQPSAQEELVAFLQQCIPEASASQLAPSPG